MSLTLRKKLIIAFAAVFCCAFGLGCSCGQASDEKGSYLLKFVSDGRTYDITVVKDNAAVTKPADPHKNGYTFDGWFFDENSWKNPVDSDIKITKDTNVYAKWTLNVYTITYLGPNDEVLNLDGFDLPATYTVEDEDIPLNEYYLTVYSFRRWTKNGLTVGYIPAGSVGDIVLYGEFQDDTTFAINYIDEFGNENNENPQSYELNEVLPELLPLNDMIDKKFVGWSNGIEIVTTIDTSCGGDITLYAEWEQKAELANFTYAVDYTYTGYNELGFLMITGVADYSAEEITVPDYVSMIAPGAFEQCKNLKSLTLPFMGVKHDDVTEHAYLGYLFGGVGVAGNAKVPSSLENLVIKNGDVIAYALKDCTNLKNIVFGENVTSIGKGAMENCNSLTEVTLPFIGQRYDESDEYNGTDKTERPSYARVQHVFGNGIPKSVKKITITKGFVTSGFEVQNALIGLYDSNVEELDYTSVNETIYEKMFAALSGSVTHLTIRGNVTKIDKNIFYRNSSVTNIVLPDTVTEIGDSAFTGAPRLKEISIPDVVTIGANAFSGCSALTKIETGDNLVSIGDGAFSGCVKLSQFYTGNKLESIGKDAFSGCSDLFRFTLPATVTSVGDGAFTGCTGMIEVRNLSALTADKGNDALGGLCKYAWDVFTSESEQSKIGDTDGYIVYKQTGGNIFIKYFGSSTTIEIPAGVKTIRQSAFYGNADIIEVVIPASVETIESEAFRNCTLLKTVRFDDSVVEFGENVFNGCTSLTSVVLPQNLQKIGVGLFDGCSSLTEIKLPSGIIEIGERAFKDTNLAHITLPDSLTKISDNTFKGSKIAEITLTDNITEIGESAFENCTELTAVTISANAALQIIGKSAFRGCAGLAGIALPESLTTIGDGAFYRCENLVSINLPSSLTGIDSQAFAYTALTSIEIPESIKVISDYAFLECHSLVDVKLPSALTEIGECAFRDCISLVTIEIPESLKIIRKGAFAYCNSLTALALPNEMDTVECGIVQMSNKLKSLAVPFIGTSLNDEDSTVTINHFFLGGVGIYGGVPDSFTTFSVYGGKIRSNSFWPKYNSNVTARPIYSITSLTLNKGVTSIEYGSLEYLLSLKTLVLPYAGVTSADKVGQTDETLEYLFNQRLSYNTTTWKNLETIGVLSGEIPVSFYNNYKNENVTNKFKTLILGKDVTKVSLQIFNTRLNTSVYYMGTEADWNNITFENNYDLETHATHYYYSKTNPFIGSGAVTSGNYWHYGTTLAETLIWQAPAA